MTSQITITVRAAFIAEKIVANLTAQLTVGSGRPCPTWCDSSTAPTPETILLQQYFQCMGAAWNDKPNLYAFRRLLAECGYEKPLSSEQVSTIGENIVGGLTVPGKEEIAIALEEYAKNKRDSEEVIANTVGTLCGAILLAMNHAIVRKAEETILKHATTLRRKRTQCLFRDDYGVLDRTRWDQEVEYFVTSVVLPAIGTASIEDPVYADIAGLVEHIAGEQPDSITDYSWEQLPEMNPEQFEAFCAEILRRQGWDIRLTKRSGDQGIDIVAQRGGITVVFQCKMYTGPVGNKAVQEVHAGKDFLGADIAVVVSTAEFTPSARELANALDVILLHYSQLEEFDKILFGRRTKPEK